MQKSDLFEELSILDDLELRYAQLRECRNDIWNSFLILKDSLASGNKLLLCGNGGSASDSLHIVGELMKEFTVKRKLDDGFRQRLLGEKCHEAEYLLKKLQGTLPAITLVDNAVINTAVQNDIAADLSFAQQVYGLGCDGDILICLTTSGNSVNTRLAALAAHARNMRVISLTGKTGGRMKEVSDICIRVPQTETYLVQELHLPVYHALCRMLECCFFINGGCD